MHGTDLPLPFTFFSAPLNILSEIRSRQFRQCPVCLTAVVWTQMVRRAFSLPFTTMSPIRVTFVPCTSHNTATIPFSTLVLQNIRSQKHSIGFDSSYRDPNKLSNICICYFKKVLMILMRFG